MTETPAEVNAQPSKEFFIDMLTRDISLSASILDLIDNAVHNLVTQHRVDVMKVILQGIKPRARIGTLIRIEFGAERFSIVDNCGGITIEDAQREVFRMGYARHEKANPGLAVYGIGMKRAIFKIGRRISLTSRCNRKSFIVDIDVDRWKKQPDWTFKLQALLPNQALDEDGTRIEITGLYPTIAQRLALESFEKDLRHRIGTTYGQFLQQGVSITVNGIQCEALLPEVSQSKQLQSARKTLHFKDVDIVIIAGVTPTDDRLPRGWYVFCNGRLVLEANKTPETGWGEANFAAFHPKYNHFIGYAFLHSRQADHLPWITTKDGVDFESPVYQFTLKEMKLQARPVLDFLNRMYPGEVQPEGVAERDVLSSGKKTALPDIGKTDTRFLACVDKKPEQQMVNINFKRSRQDIERIKASLKKPRWPATKVAEYCMDYYMKRECQ